MLRRLLLPLALLLVTAARIDAATIVYSTELTGPNEAPPNASPGIGFAILTYDDVLHTMSYDVEFLGLVAPTTAAHVHCCTAVPFAGTAGVATTTPSFPGFPLGVTAGTFVATFDLTLPSSWRAGFLATEGGGTTAGAEAALIAGLESGRAYFNIHTTTFPGGEIRGFLVPEPMTLTLLGLGLAAVGVQARRRRTKSRT
jgi:hypothetical protein